MLEAWDAAGDKGPTGLEPNLLIINEKCLYLSIFSGKIKIPK
jgi:hypothetical protein